MGGVLASVMEQKEDEAIQSHTGLTHRQVDIIIHTWADIKKFGAEEAGVIMFLRIFKAAPETLSMFRDFRDAQHWAQSKEFRHHCKIWMNILGSAVGLLKDPDSLDSTLEYLGMKHEGFNITMAHFDLMGVEFIETFREILGNDMTPEVEKAWKAMYKFMADFIIAGMNRNDKNDNDSKNVI